jgi:Fic family protein
MNSKRSYAPPFTLNNEILSLVAAISQQLGQLSAEQNTHKSQSELLLRKVNRVRTIQGSLAIEGNKFSEDQITAILEGKRVIAPAREVQEASNALAVYETLDTLQYDQENALSLEKKMLSAHKTLMLGLIDSAGQYRQSGVGVIKNNKVIHMAPPAHLVPKLMVDLFAWLAEADDHLLIKSCVFHYEFEFIHPFADGNGRMGRLWQTVILKQHHPVFAYLPVESLVSKHQEEYYQAIGQSTKASNSAPFIAFMLSMINKALDELQTDQLLSIQLLSIQKSPQESPQVTPQVIQLLKVMLMAIVKVTVTVKEGKNSFKSKAFKREQLQTLLGLSDKKSFNLRYLKPALAQGLVEMTIPDKPTSKLQQYKLTALGKSTYSAQE